MMKQLRPAESADLPALKRLWKVCFGDADAYIDFYFIHGYPGGQTLVLTLDGQPVSMLTLLPVTLSAGAATLEGQYVYAVATDPSQRGKGWMRELMAYADARCRQQKQDFTCLVPATSSLFALYASHGYSTCTTQERFTLSAEMMQEYAVQIAPCSKDTYFHARHAWLASMDTALFFTEETYLQAEMDSTQSDTLRLETPLETGFAAVFRDGDCLLLRETSLSKEGVLQAAAALCARYGCTRMAVRLPQGETPYAMWKPLTEGWTLPSCYMNLMLD